jgi:hypothetical protein
MPDQFVAVASPAAMDRDADARPEREVAAGDHDRLREARMQTRRDRDGSRLSGARDQQRELVAAEASQRVRRSGELVEAARDLTQ